MTSYDETVRAEADDECRAWIRKVINARNELGAFVDARLDGKGTAKYLLDPWKDLSISAFIQDSANGQALLFALPNLAIHCRHGVPKRLRTKCGLPSIVVSIQLSRYLVYTAGLTWGESTALRVVHYHAFHWRDSTVNFSQTINWRRLNRYDSKSKHWWAYARYHLH